MSSDKIAGIEPGAEESLQKKEAFAELAHAVCLFYCPEYQAETVRNKDGSRMGIALWEEGSATAFTIWLDRIYQNYREGWSLYRVLNELQAACRDVALPKETLADFVADFTLIRPRICYRLVNRYRDRELLETVPHVIWLDLAIVFYILVSVKDGKGNSVMIDNSLMKKWRLKDAEGLYAIAGENMRRIFPGSIRPMEEIFRSFEESREEGEGKPAEGNTGLCTDTGESPLYVATNTEMLNGAGVVLYDGLLRSFAESVGKDLYLIPSSVHEMVIALEGEKEGEKERLEGIVREANRSLVEGKEVLSGHIYRYDRTADRVEVI